jgi:hypothetical protein
MAGDRYLKLILTIIALELLWLGAKDFGAPLAAQQAPPAATRVVIAGVDLDTGNGLRSAFLPARIDGEVRIVATSPLKIEAAGPLKVEADRPLPVQNVDYLPRTRPGE